MDTIRAAASFYGPPAKITCSSDIRLRDGELSAELTATTAFTATRIEAPEQDGIMIILRLSPTSANITLDETDADSNIRHGGAGTVVLTAGDTIILRFSKVDGQWHELKRISH